MGRTHRRKSKPYQNRFAMAAVSFVVVVLLAVISFKSVELQAKSNTYSNRISVLEKEIKKEEDRTKEIAEYKKYVKTKKYVEEVAKDKLGLVYEDEVLFKPEK